MKLFASIFTVYCLVVLLTTAPLKANNIQISNVKFPKTDLQADGYISISFSVSWDHSWRMAAFKNWDAAWIFGKSYSRDRGMWEHVHFDPDTNRHSINGTSPAGTAMKLRVEKTGLGSLLYRSSEGSGPIQADITMWWNYSGTGSPNYNIVDTVTVSLFAIEMVYIPQGEYRPGDEISTNTLYNIGKNINVGAGQSGTEAIEDSAGYSYNGVSIPEAYPLGYGEFYLMKHEISQHAYVDFLNCLDFSQQAGRTAVSPDSPEGTLALVTGTYANNPSQYRNYIRIKVAGNNIVFPEQPAVYGNSVLGIDSWLREDNAGNVACNFLLWEDLLAYADWACMRPFTEMEYEKACRGYKQYTYSDYAWGQGYVDYITAVNGKYFMHEDSTNEESLRKTAGVVFLGEPNAIETGKAPWVMRVGAFAKDSTWRGQSGAGYYGVLNMSDNVWERCINVHIEESRQFVPQNGDGRITVDGRANVAPAWVTVTGFDRTILRGFQVSDRRFITFPAADVANLNRRHPAVGGRLAITITPELAD